MDFRTKDFEKQNKKTKILQTAQKPVSWKLLWFNWRWNSAKRLDWCLQYARHANTFFLPKSETMAMIIYLVCSNQPLDVFDVFVRWILILRAPGLINETNEIQWKLKCLSCRADKQKCGHAFWMSMENGNIKFYDNDDMVLCTFTWIHTDTPWWYSMFSDSGLQFCGFWLLSFFFSFE